MTETLFNIGRRGSEVLHTYKGQLSMEMGGIETGTLKLYRPIFGFLPVIGLNIKEGKSTTHNVIRMLYLFILLLISVWLAGCQLYPMLSRELTRESSWYVSGTDQYVVVTIVYVAAFKNQNIGQLLRDIWSVYIETADVRGANRRLKRWQWALWAVTVVNIVVVGWIALVMTMVTDYHIGFSQFRKEFFGIETENVIVIRIVSLMTYMALQFCVIVLCLFGCFIFIQCVLIKESFSGLHATLRANGDRYLHGYLIMHRKLSGIVNKFNETFHPVILVLVCVLMMQIVTLTEDLSKMVLLTVDRPYQMISLYSLYLVQTIMIFVIFVYFGNEIQSEARNGIEILLDSSISVRSSTNKELHDNKNGQMISLFIAQLNTAPVAISASGIFVINVNLVTIVISIALTYLTFVNSLQPDNSNKAIALPMAPFNFSNFSVLDNSFATP